DVEAVLVVESVVHEPTPGTLEHLLRLPDHRRLDAPAGDTARDLAIRRDRQCSARVTRRRADSLDDRAEGDRGARACPPLQDLDDVLHQGPVFNSWFRR